MPFCRPGRVHARLGPQRSAVKDTDWHQLAEDRFALEVADALNRLALANRFQKLILVAPPKVLGNLRMAFHKRCGTGGERSAPR
jgi:protein required for attachment to host cells